MEEEDKIVTLNVGGRRFQTRISTLQRYPNTLLGAMFSPHNRDMVQPNVDNEFFFDRNALVFPQILEFYRTGSLDLTMTRLSAMDSGEDDVSLAFSKNSVMPTDLVALREEMDFFQIPETIWTPAVFRQLHARAATRMAHFTDLLLLLCRLHLDNFIDIVVVHFSRGEEHDSASLRNVNRSMESSCRPILDQCAEVGFRLLSDEKTCSIVREILRRRYAGLRMSVQMVRHELLVLCLSGYLDVDRIRENLGLTSSGSVGSESPPVNASIPGAMMQSMPRPSTSSTSPMTTAPFILPTTSTSNPSVTSTTTAPMATISVSATPVHSHSGSVSHVGHTALSGVRSLLGRPGTSGGGNTHH